MCKAWTEFIPTPMVWETKNQPGLYQVSGRTEEQKPWEKTGIGKAATGKKKIFPRSQVGRRVWHGQHSQSNKRGEFEPTTAQRKSVAEEVQRN